MEDSVFWAKEDNGAYSVRSAYRLTKGLCNDARDYAWKGVWKLNIPPRLNVSFWALCSMNLLTKDVLMIKHVQCDPVCSLCGMVEESAVHLFANCSLFCPCLLESSES